MTGARGAQHAERIVEADGGVAGIDEPAGELAEIFEAVPRYLVVDDDPFRLLAGAGYRGRAALEVAHVVERVVATEDIDTRGGGRFDERVDEIVRDLTVPHE
jgi:hypothetical protein